MQEEADAEDGCQNERQFHALGKQLPKTLGDVIGRAAIRLTIFVIASVVACQRNLGTLQRHTEQSGDPQPEQSAGAANGNRCCYTADITDTDCAANGSSGCLDALTCPEPCSFWDLSNRAPNVSLQK